MGSFAVRLPDFQIHVSNFLPDLMTFVKKIRFDLFVFLLGWCGLGNLVAFGTHPFEDMGIQASYLLIGTRVQDEEPAGLVTNALERFQFFHIDIFESAFELENTTESTVQTFVLSQLVSFDPTIQDLMPFLLLLQEPLKELER